MQNFRIVLDADYSDLIVDYSNLDGVVDGAQEAAPTQADPGTETTAGTVTPSGTGTAYAQPTMMESILPMIIMVPLMIGAYWLMTRGQRKREKQMKEMQASIKAGDNVITAGGFFGRVVSVGEDCYNVEFGTNRSIHIPVLKTDILGIRAPKMTPAPKEIESK
jgi:preprotein translocase subunit YajC